MPTVSLIEGVVLSGVGDGARRGRRVALERREGQGSPRTRARAPRDIRPRKPVPEARRAGGPIARPAQGSLASSPAPPGAPPRTATTLWSIYAI